MLVLTEPVTGEKHSFVLKNTELSNVGEMPSSTFMLASDTYADLDLRFAFPYQHVSPPEGYTVSIHFFKNSFHLQSQIIDLRINGLEINTGKVGYAFRLDALFERDLLQISNHIYPYAYLAADHLFRSQITFQTNTVLISSEPLKITDFFEDDIIVFVLCEQYYNRIPSFNFYNYLPDLFTFGFILYSAENPVNKMNEHSFIREKYAEITKDIKPNNVYPLRLEQANAVISGESYITHIFSNLIQKNMDPATRFLMLYQVIEILISKVIPYEIESKIFPQIATLTPSKLKESLSELSNSSNLIVSIFHIYSPPTEQLKEKLKIAILDFFVHIGHPEYADIAKHADMKPTTVFYSLRNKLVHEYRAWHNQEVDFEVTIEKMNQIITITEVVIADMIKNCKLQLITPRPAIGV